MRLLVRAYRMAKAQQQNVRLDSVAVMISAVEAFIATSSGAVGCSATGNTSIDFRVKHLAK